MFAFLRQTQCGRIGHAKQNQEDVYLKTKLSQSYYVENLPQKVALLSCDGVLFKNEGSVMLARSVWAGCRASLPPQGEEIWRL